MNIPDIMNFYCQVVSRNPDDILDHRNLCFRMNTCTFQVRKRTTDPNEWNVYVKQCYNITLKTIASKLSSRRQVIIDTNAINLPFERQNDTKLK